MTLAYSQNLLSLQALPVELLVDIFSSLDCIAILTCKQVCRLFNGLIASTATLQLIIELHAAGQENGPSNPEVSPADRLDALRKREAAWDKLQWSKEERMPMLNGTLWELYGGVFAQSDGLDSIKFRRLPSIYRSIDEAEWTIGDFGHPLRDFGMDPAQDLLVLVESHRWSYNPDRSYHLHLRTMSTGGPHPKAPDPPIISYPQTNQHSQLSIQISAQHLGILFSSAQPGENELIIWEWMSGKIEVALISDDFQSFAFLTERHIIIALLTMPDLYDTLEPSLIVLDFKAESNERQAVEEAEHVYSFRYPPLKATANPIKFEIRTDPSPSWVPDHGLKVPFYIAKYNRVYVISLWLLVHDRLRYVTLLVPLATFLSCMDGSPSRHTAKEFQWFDWGPQGSRMLMTHIPSDVWVCYIYGSKYVTLRKDKKGFVVDVYDFNQRALSRALKKGHETDDEIYAIDPSTLEDGEIFGDGIETSLPYRLRTLPLNLRSIAHVAVLCSEDSLIILDSHINSREYRILTF